MMRELIRSGFVGQAQPGDSVDIWLYDQANNISSFPPQIWDSSEADKIADAAATFISQQKFRGISRFGPVAADLAALMPNTKKLLVVILTDGEEPFSDISADVEINEYVAKLKRVMPPKHPLVISLAAVHGRIQQWAVYNGDGKNDLAALPARPKPAPAAPIVAKAKEKEPETKTEPKKKKEPEKPFVFELPPGTRISTPPGPAQQVVSTKAVPAAVARETSTKLPEATKHTNATTTVASAIITNSAAQPPKAQPAPVPQTQTVIQANSQANVSKTAAPTIVSVAPKPQTNAVMPAPAARSSNLVAIASASRTNPPGVSAKTGESPAKTVDAAKTAPPVVVAETSTAPITVRALSQSAIPAAAIFGGLVLAGLGIITLGGFLFLKKAKARQDGSIISQSLLR
jgi:hypothetical protein